ncbi:hypothetical protein yc1106_04929 [Curvularia clavata]|uniref:Ankyrin repeat protein n=1 Tax=Curvularia clavata TaxID=95742 RepID=A0A9Q8Z8L1_CURCL|nr:hypothetical protein yc1106_04929 [Curvularia clavata]
MENSDLEGINHGGKTLADRVAQAEESFDTLPVHKAAEQGDISKLTSLVHTAENIDDYDTYNQCTPLHLAIQGDHAEAVKILLEAGADPEKLDYSDTAVDPPHPAVDLAAWLGSCKSLRVLIDHGVAVSPYSLVLAASLNRTDCMTIILQELNKDNSLHGTRQEYVRTALMSAAQCWHTEAVELLLTHVAGFPDLNAIEDGVSLTEALFMALEEYCCDHFCRECLYQRSPDRYQNLSQRFLSMLQSLVHHGADINATVSETDMTRFWLLTYPVPSFDLESVLGFLLLKGLRVDEGPRIDDDIGEYHPSPIMVALTYVKEIEIIKAMVEAGASYKVTDQSLRTPLHLAQTRAIAEFLCNLGADISAKDDQGQMPLHTACHGVHADVVDLLISSGSSVNEVATENQWTPLHFATCRRHELTSHIYVSEESWNMATSTPRLQTAQILLKNGASIQATASDGRTALHGAAQKGDINLIRFLLEQGADVNAATVAGETALHMVIASRAIQTPTEPQISAMTALLLDYGANLEAKDEIGATPLRKAIDSMVSVNKKIGPRSNPGRFNMLIEKGADRYITDNAGIRVEDLVDFDYWLFDKIGRLKLKSMLDLPNTRYAMPKFAWGRYSG